ncbi:MAG: 3-keto-disaccharide hydrolase [Bryobacteraceae bacterium]
MLRVRGLLPTLVCLALPCACLGASLNDQQFNGRWDIAVSGASPPKAWWLEVSGAGTDVVKGKFVGAPGGQLDDIPKITIFDGEMRFSFERRYHKDPKQLEKGLYWARIEAGKLKGTFEIEGDPFSYLEWTGVRAPTLADKDDGAWKRGDPINVFNGRDLTGWQPVGMTRSAAWMVKDALLTNSPGATDLVSERKFQNFDLHVEYLIGPRSNSGIGLRGRYEVQILDDYGKPASLHSNGALYSRVAPSMNASKPPGEWQTFDIRLIGRQVSVALNGLKIIDKANIDGLTAIAIDPNEADPGPIVLQGDHGLVQFRKIVLYPLLKVR